MRPLASFLRTIRKESEDLSRLVRDEDLLARYVESRDESAFEEMLRRYGPLVMGVARRMVSDRAAAEDVFQATFLTFVAKADTIRHRESVGSWLVRVAHQNGKLTLREIARARAREARVAVSEQTHPKADLGLGADIVPVIDEEIQRLPDRYRTAINLCCVLEKPYAEAGAELGISGPAVWKRVQKGLTLLKTRLEARGVGMSAAAISAAISTGVSGQATAAASLPAMIRSAASLLSGATEGLPESAAALAKAEAANTLRIFRTAVLVFGAVVAVGAVGFAALNTGQPDSPPAPKVEAKPAPTRELKPLTEITGVAKSVDGTPVRHAKISVFAKEYARGEAGGSDRLLGTAIADERGNYRIAVPPFDAPIEEARRVKLMSANAAGQAVSSIEVNLLPGVSAVTQDLLVAASRALTGKVVDSQGTPVASAKVFVTRLGATSIDPVVGGTDPLPANWPAEVRTDSAGRFAIPGLASNVDVKLAIEPKHHSFAVVLIPGDRTEPVEIVVGSPRWIEGRVVAQASGEPVPRAKVTLMAPAGKGERMIGRKFLADSDGQFSILLPDTDRCAVQAYAPDGAVLLPAIKSVVFPGKTQTRTVELKLAAGVEIRGQVREPDGRPSPGAIVQYLSRDAVTNTGGVLTGGAGYSTTDTDGRFSAVVPPSKGTLLVYGKSLDYRPEIADLGTLRSGTATGSRVYAHAVLPLTVEKDKASRPIEVSLKAATSINLRVQMPDGSPLANGFVLCRHLSWPFELRTSVPVPVKDGQSRLPGCTPGRRYTIVVFDSEQRAGAIADVSCVADAKEPVTIPLKPLGTVIGRVTRADGGSLGGTPYNVVVQLPFDGPDDGSTRASRGADSSSGLLVRNQMRTSKEPIDDDGRVCLTGMIPGARYRFGVPKGTTWSWIEYEIAAGKTAELPAIVVE